MGRKGQRKPRGEDFPDPHLACSSPAGLEGGLMGGMVGLDSQPSTGQDKIILIEKNILGVTHKETQGQFDINNGRKFIFARSVCCL